MQNIANFIFTLCLSETILEAGLSQASTLVIPSQKNSLSNYYFQFNAIMKNVHFLQGESFSLSLAHDSKYIPAVEEITGFSIVLPCFSPLFINSLGCLWLLLGWRKGKEKRERSREVFT